MRLIAFAALVATAVAGAAFVGGGRSAVATIILLPAGAALSYVLWRASRAAHAQRGRRRIASYAGVAALALVEFVAFSLLVWVAAALAEGLFPFDDEGHGA